MEQLSGKVAVVTGAASGIGYATSDALAREGAKVVMADIEEKALEAAAKVLREAGHSVLPVVTDVSVFDSVEALASRTVEEFGAVHIVHNNAGVATGGLSWELSERDWKWVLGVNLWGVVNGIRAFVPRIIEAGEGHVVNTASMAGIVSAPFMSAYNVSKHGVVTLSETLFKELAMAAPTVGVSVLCPGWVNTGIGESSRNRPDELRDAGDKGDLADLGSGMLKGLLEAGLAPTTVAAMVVDAIKQNRFYIFTHEDWMAQADGRFDDIRERRNPTGGFLPT